MGTFRATGYLEATYANSQAPAATANAEERRAALARRYAAQNVAHPFTGIHVTEKGLDIMEQYVADVRSVIGYEVPLASDHFGHIGIQDCIKIARRLDRYNLAWYEDMLPCR